MCAMEAVAWLNGELHSDAPSCTAAPLQRFVTRTNDWMLDAERPALKPFLLRLISTSSVGPDGDRNAAFLFAGWACEEAAIALDARKQHALAERARSVSGIVDRDTAIKARDEMREVRAAASAVGGAAAYGVAAADAAYAAAYGVAAVAAAAYAAYAVAYGVAAVDAADAADAADAVPAAARSAALTRRLAILDKVLTEAYGK